MRCIFGGDPRAVRLSACLLVLLLMSVSMGTASAAGKNNVHFYGVLTADVCVIASGKELIPVVFDPISVSELYHSRRIPGKRFELHLAECDLSGGNQVAITFLGDENATLPGFLALEANSEAQGIAIGLETLEGKLIPVKKAGDKYELQAGSNIIALQAFIQGEPQALVNKKIKPGKFQSSAMIELEYY